jgi:hypothetical protein
MSLMQAMRRRLRPWTVADYTARLVRDCNLALDIGCGSDSHLSAFRPRLVTIGIDAFPAAVEEAKAKNLHDHYLVADILSANFSEVMERVRAIGQVDLVSLYGVIEHLPKSKGYEILDRCDQLTSKYVILETPNGFVEQGPEFGNEFQRHLSGWFIHDFEGRGYRVHGTLGTRYFRGYAGGAKYDFPGCILLDEMLTLFLRVNGNPQHGFNLVAIKDVRGVPARLGPRKV